MIVRQTPVLPQRVRALALCGLGCLLWLLAPVALRAQPGPSHARFSLSVDEPLDGALRRFIQVAGVGLVYSADMTAGKRARCRYHL